MLYQNLRRVRSDSSDVGTIVPAGVQIGLGVKTAAVYRITEQGNLTLTENTFDLAINGDGYFEVLLPNGDTAYSRASSFEVSADGEIVTADGFTVQPGITIPNDAVDVSVNASGQVLVQQDGQVAPSNVGQLQLAIFSNEACLLAIGDNLFLETPASGTPTTGNPGSSGIGTIQQGFLETSNVNVVEEITNLITAQRAYETNSKVIETSDQMMSTLNNIR